MGLDPVDVSGDDIYASIETLAVQPTAPSRQPLLETSNLPQTRSKIMSKEKHIDNSEPKDEDRITNKPDRVGLSKNMAEERVGNHSCEVRRDNQWSLMKPETGDECKERQENIDISVHQSTDKPGSCVRISPDAPGTRSRTNLTDSKPGDREGRKRSKKFRSLSHSRLLGSRSQIRGKLILMFLQIGIIGILRMFSNFLNFSPSLFYLSVNTRINGQTWY